MNSSEAVLHLASGEVSLLCEVALSDPSSVTISTRVPDSSTSFLRAVRRDHGSWDPRGGEGPVWTGVSVEGGVNGEASEESSWR